MNIGIVDVDGHNFPNFALMKISAWHKSLTSGGLFPETAIDAKAFLEDYFKIDLTIHPKHN